LTLIDDPDFAPGGSLKAKGINPMIQAELADGEKLIWVGQPRQNRSPGSPPTSFRISCLLIGVIVGLIGLFSLLIGLFDRADLQVEPFLLGLFLVAISLVVVVAGFSDRISGFFTETGIHLPFGSIGTWFDRRTRDTWYALTDRRVILSEPALFGRVVQVRSIRANELSGMKRLQREDGSGALFLEIMARLPSEQTGLVIMAGLPSGQTGLVTLVHLRGIEDVRSVEALIRATLFAD